jgi:hypothetical protein
VELGNPAKAVMLEGEDKSLQGITVSERDEKASWKESLRAGYGVSESRHAGFDV